MEDKQIVAPSEIVTEDALEDRRTKDLLERHVKNADMSEEMQLDAISIAQKAQEVYLVEKDIASFIRREFENKYNPTWHCIVGRNFGSFITHETKHFIYFYTGQVAILLFKAG
jgi:dynein light chain LC8-type